MYCEAGRMLNYMNIYIIYIMDYVVPEYFSGNVRIPVYQRLKAAIDPNMNFESELLYGTFSRLLCKGHCCIIGDICASLPDNICFYHSLATLVC